MLPSATGAASVTGITGNSDVTAANRCNACRQRESSPAVDDLDYVARCRPDAEIINRTPSQLACLRRVLDTPHTALLAEHLTDTGMWPDAAADLLAQLAHCPDGELRRRIQATPTLRDWFGHLAQPVSDRPDNDALILSLRVLQLFAHPTSVPVVFDPIRRTVLLAYAPGRAPHDGAVPADGVIARALLDAATCHPPYLVNRPAFNASRNALDLLVRTNDIDGRRQRSPFWQNGTDYWSHGGEVVRFVSTHLTPEFEAWLEARRDTAVSHSFRYIHRDAGAVPPPTRA
ncbi:hypothetical protein PIN31009_00653 [Pandoraea iniqua]|uniref:hypothetical protein n=1 Tax=Pandoraea iniqua TaxID=2508288 RepID=UPI0012411C7B|nr:hypothetical protein [Pandoraea iniqua]VVD71839.1 hypothetical protein PIN31009_00653 [Pandoraea iniqua]